jgi:hypothetical protein
VSKNKNLKDEKSTTYLMISTAKIDRSYAVQDALFSVKTIEIIPSPP